MSSSSTSSTFGGIHVAIKPLQAAYFAGEPLSVQITFTNTRSAVGPPSTTRPSTQTTFIPTHKRASHSVSSAPISRPPTSPGTPKTGSPVTSTFPSSSATRKSKLERKGIIGTKTKRRTPSIDGVSFQREQEEKPARSPARTLVDRNGSIHASHPHARKNSVVGLQSPTPTTLPNYSVSLDSISEAATPNVPPTPQIPSPAPPPIPSFQTRAVPGPQSRRSSVPPIILTSRSTSSTYAPPGTELLLYAYAQLSGTFTLESTNPSSDNLRRKLKRGRPVGGGSMDIAAKRPTHRRAGSSSFRNSLLGGMWGSQVPTPTEDVMFQDENTELPTFDVPPTPLAVDLSLAAGESRSFTYTISLPDSIPPTFRGRLVKFDYHLIVGASRAQSHLDPAGIGSPGGLSSVMRVPLRIYGNVATNRPSRPYDLLWPLEKAKSVPEKPRVNELPSLSLHRKSVVAGLSVNSKPSGIDDLVHYAASLLHAGVGANGLDRDLSVEHVDSGMSGGLHGCREAVEILTRVSKKVSYDVMKDEIPVATLTFAKGAYRLGETLLGVLEVNEPTVMGGKVLKFSAMLEAHETLPPSLRSPIPGSNRALRRVHAEHHTDLLNCTTRLSFGLDIPSDAAPAFRILDSSADDDGTGGLEWKVRICLLVAMPDSKAKETGRRTRQREIRMLDRDGKEGLWGSSYTACTEITPLERISKDAQSNGVEAQGWISYLTSPFLGSGSQETRYHDGDVDTSSSPPQSPRPSSTSEEEEDAASSRSWVRQKWKGKGKEGELESDGLGSPKDWRRMKTEMVECEVGLQVWPGNTAFRATEVTFEV
ncbi:Rgp1-domain-containing protein [Sistotremastrum niveocremeum HHB9708]|uniref:Rgp1-domain-containing protein n=1 Tax=Sistotremastrum niveocremeum HHB9708 TaxID=1314777 RepID=A0A164R9I8_9AGAM|nr:Rgp1-domain-containing protein [Sistotremastrum niveocremeum HHB9708]